METGQVKWSQDKVDPLNEQIYAIFYTKFDGMGSPGDAFLSFRRDFFKQGRRSARINKKDVISGFSAKIKGRMTAHSMSWKLAVGSAVTEEIVSNQGGYTFVKRGYNGALLSRCYYDNNHEWQKSEYYGANPSVPQIVLTPVDWRNKIEIRELKENSKTYKARTLYPAPYENLSPYQKVVDTIYGKPTLMIYAMSGTYCYCSEKSIRERQTAMEEINKNPILTQADWKIESEVKRDKPVQVDFVFKDMEHAAEIIKKTEQEDIETPAEGTVFSEKAEIKVNADIEFSDYISEPEASSDRESETSPASEEKTAAEPKADSGDAAENIVKAFEGEPIHPKDLSPFDGAHKMLRDLAKTEAPDMPKLSSNSGTLKADGKDRGTAQTRIEQDGVTVYEGGYADGKREGFGAYYYKDGLLCHAGFWKEGKKEGLGVAFRHEDQALHVANWKENRPVGFVSLFDSDGNFKYGGKMTKGKKDGVGVSYDNEQKSVFVSRWDNGEYSGYGSVFNEDGMLMYSGMWKDGKRSGRGTSFDNDGGVLFYGEWRDGQEYKGVLFTDGIPETEED